MASAYPSGPVEVEGFCYCDNLYLSRARGAVKNRRGKDANYIVARQYHVLVKVKVAGATYWFPITVPAGLKTDLSSVPWWGRWYVGRVGPHLEASIIHDWLYVAWQHEGIKATEQRRKFADDVILAAMKEANVDCRRRWVIYKAVSWFGWSAFYF